MSNATPEVPSLESLAHALFDAFYASFGGSLPDWPTYDAALRNGWLAVAQTASDGASIAAKAVTDALAGERDKARRERNEALDRIIALPHDMKDAMRQIAHLEARVTALTQALEREAAKDAENERLRAALEGARVKRDANGAELSALRVRLGELADHWNREYASEAGWPSRCAIELREALEAPDA